MDKKTAEIVNTVVDNRVNKDGLKVGDKYPTEFTSSRGLKLKLKAVPTVTVWEAQARVPEPPVPTFYDADVDRDRENPLDPAYRAALNNAAIEKARVGQYIRLGLGTQLLGVVEGDLLPIESSDWSDILVMAGVQVAEKGVARYIDWLRLYALSDEDQATLINAIERAGSTVTEDEVAAAEDSFRDNTIREVVKDISAN